MRKISLLLILLLFSCKKENEEGALPPPIKPVVYENINETKKLKSEKIAKEIKTTDFSVASTVVDSCESMCQKVKECLDSMNIKQLGSNCLKRCSYFSNETKSAISGNTDCKKIAFSYNKFNCEYSCNLLARSSEGKNPLSLGGDTNMCLFECMKGTYEAMKIFNAINCFFSKDKPEEISDCNKFLDDAKPINDINDFLK